MDRVGKTGGVSGQLTLMRAKDSLYPHQDPRPGEGPNLPTTIPTQPDTSIKTRRPKNLWSAACGQRTTSDGRIGRRSLHSLNVHIVKNFDSTIHDFHDDDLATTRTNLPDGFNNI
jgi:hypothetical protein